MYHGDALEVLPTLKDQSVQAIIIDPPYGIAYQSNHRTGGKFDPLHGDEKPFLGWGAESYRVTANDGCILCFCRWDTQEAFIEELRSANWLVKSQVIWDKGNHSMGDLKGEFGLRHELILFARKPDFAFPGRRPVSIIFSPRVGSNQMVHPTEKPVKLLEELIGYVTVKGDTVLDFTMGSGSTGVAAVKMNRFFIGVELDKGYYELASTRISNAAGEFRRTNREQSSGQLSLFGE